MSNANDANHERWKLKCVVDNTKKRLNDATPAEWDSLRQQAAWEKIESDSKAVLQSLEELDRRLTDLLDSPKPAA